MWEVQKISTNQPNKQTNYLDSFHNQWKIYSDNCNKKQEPYEPGIPLLSKYLEKIIIQKDTRTQCSL